MYFVSKKDADGVWDIVMIMVTHVDDLAWSDTPESKDIIKYIKGKFPIDKEATGDFKFTGHEITQGDDFTVRLKCRDTTMKMGKLNFSPGEKSGDRKATTEENNQCRSLSGSLIWISRVCRPDVSYRVSALQQRVNNLTLPDLNECNNVVEFAKEDPDKGCWAGGAPAWGRSQTQAMQKKRNGWRLRGP